MAESTSTMQDSAVLGICVEASTPILNVAEIREMIMLQLDPLALLNLIRISWAAFATFKQNSTKFLNSTLAILDVDYNAGTIPMAILEASKARLDDEDEEDLGREMVRYMRGGVKPKTNLEEFLSEFVKKGHTRFPDNVQQPLYSLRQVAKIYEAVEILVHSRTIWTCILKARPLSSILGHWFCDKKEVRRLLWVYQLHCTLYHRPGTAGKGGVIFPSTESQLKYMKLVKEQESDTFMKGLVNIYRDLSSFLGKLYEKNWPKIFCENFEYYSKLSQDSLDGKPLTRYKLTFPERYIDPEFWSDRKVVQDTHCDFYQYVDYQMSRGLPHLARMYRLSLKVKPSQYPVQKYWTNSFFTKAFNHLDYGNPDLCGWTPSKSYLLEPLKDEKKGGKKGGKNGYRLSMTVPSSSGAYLIRTVKPLFVDEELKPNHLGSLEYCWLRGEVN